MSDLERTHYVMVWCNRYADKLKRLGVDPTEYAQTFLDQDESCAICHAPLVMDTPNKRNAPCIDCDAIGNLRGLICVLCDIVISCTGGNIQLLRDTVTYLEQHKVNQVSRD